MVSYMYSMYKIFQLFPLIITPIFVGLPEQIVAMMKMKCSVWKKGARLDMAMHMTR